MHGGVSRVDLCGFKERRYPCSFQTANEALQAPSFDPSTYCSAVETLCKVSEEHEPIDIELQDSRCIFWAWQRSVSERTYETGDGGNNLPIRSLAFTASVASDADHLTATPPISRLHQRGCHAITPVTDAAL